MRSTTSPFFLYISCSSAKELWILFFIIKQITRKDSLKISSTLRSFLTFSRNSGLLACFNVVESNMISRRAEVTRLLENGESIMSISFPALGTPDFTSPPYEPRPDDINSFGCSLFFPDEVIYGGHPRYGMLFWYAVYFSIPQLLIKF